VFFIAQSQFFLRVLGGCASQFIIERRQVLAFLGIGSRFFGKKRGLQTIGNRDFLLNKDF